MAEPSQRFLVVRLSSLGDIVHTLPAVAALGRTYPQAEIHWLVEDRYAVLLQGNPYVHHLIRLDTLGWRKRLTSADNLLDVIQGLIRLREFCYDKAIDFQGLMKSAILARLSRSEERVGLAERWLREPAAAAFYTQLVRPHERKHIIEINLSLVEHLGARSEHWEFPLPETPEDNAAVSERRRQLGVAEYILVNPGGGWMAKCWPPDSYAALVRRLADELPFDILLTGSEQENVLIKGILARARSARVKYFPSTLVEFIALARRARLLIGGDTGPLHLAAAVGTPLVAIFNSADRRNTPERNGPFHPRDIVLWSREGWNNGRHTKNSGYLEGVNVESVLAAVLSRLARVHA